MKRILLAILFILSLTALHSKDYPKNPYVDDAVWDELTPYFLPYDHPLRSKLDKIFENSRAIENKTAMRKAGFTTPNPRKHTHVVVSKHPKLSGYLIKAHLDDQKFRYNLPEYSFWKMRIKGAKAIQELIDRRELNHLFVVPKKWIYPLPAEPSPSNLKLRKNFILVVENVHIHIDNEKIWKNSSTINKANLTHLYWLLSDLGLWDCCKIANIPFTRDEKIAFVDTETCYRWPVKFYTLTDSLSSEMKKFWLTLPNTKSP